MSVLEKISGRILDSDSHEWVPARLWEQEFGECTAPLAAMIQMLPQTGHQGQWGLDVTRDDAPIDPSTIHSVKGPTSPGAFDMHRRVEVLDALGIESQLIFTGGPGGLGLVTATTKFEVLTQTILAGLPQEIVDRVDSLDTAALAGQLIKAFNDWAIRIAAISDRLRPVGLVDTTELKSAISHAEELIDAGIRALNIQSAVLPGGLSPADEALDPFWRVFTEGNVPLLFHLGGEFGFLRPEWGSAEIFEVNRTTTLEAPLDPYHMSTYHMAHQNFITAMVLGGVFERHPNLRVGAIELTAHWIGPMSENCDFWVDAFASRFADKLSIKPSEYLARNVRVTAMPWEPVDKYIDRFGLEDVYMFGSDYPHYEGGPNAAVVHAERLLRLGPEVLEKFFVTNPQLLFP